MIPRTQKTIGQFSHLNYQELYEEEKKLKEVFQKRAEIAELKNKKYFQNLNQKCFKCSNSNFFSSKPEQINQLKQFKFNLDHKFSSSPHPSTESLIQNFAIFGTPQSLLTDLDEINADDEGQLLYVSNFPTEIALHSAKLAFPYGNKHRIYNGSQARQKAIQIMSNNCSLIKTFIMNFQPGEQSETKTQLIQTINPDNRIFAICLKVQDFTVVSNFNGKVCESQKNIKKQQKSASTKAFSCDDTDITMNDDTFCSIVTSERVYCIFSQFPFFSFYEQFLKSMISLAKTERLVVYRESGCSISEADSYFFLSRVKELFREMESQLKNWQLGLNKQLQIKLITCQKLSLSLHQQQCKNNYIESWGLPILQLFSVEKFIQVFTLIMLEEKVVFICENQYILTYAVHLFTRILTRPFKYPYPSVYLLPNEQQYLNAPFPIVYGFFASKQKLQNKKLHQKYKNTYIWLSREGVQIVSYNSKKETLKKCSPILKDRLTAKFKNIHEFTKRPSHFTVEDDSIGILKDKNGLTASVVNEVKSYLQKTIANNMPSSQEMQRLKEEVRNKMSVECDQTQQICKQVVSRWSGRVKDPFFNALLHTQLINMYLFS